MSANTAHKKQDRPTTFKVAGFPGPEQAVFQAPPPQPMTQNGVLHLRIIYTLDPNNTVPADGNIPYDYDPTLSGVYNLSTGSDISDFTDMVRDGSLGTPNIPWQNVSEPYTPTPPATTPTRTPVLSAARFVVYSIVNNGPAAFRMSRDAVATDDAYASEYYRLTHVLKNGDTVRGNDLSTVPRPSTFDKCYVLYFKTKCPSTKGSPLPPNTLPDKFNLHVVVHQDDGTDKDGVIDPDIKNTGRPPGH